MPIRHRGLSVLGMNVLRKREARGWSQETLAEKAGLDRTYISGIERGVRNPSVLTLLRLAGALGTTFEELAQNVK